MICIKSSRRPPVVKKPSEWGGVSPRFDLNFVERKCVVS